MNAFAHTLITNSYTNQPQFATIKYQPNPNYMQRAYAAEQPSLKEMIPFKIYDRCRLYEGSPRPFYIPIWLENHLDIAWHSTFQCFYPHTYDYRLKKALVDSDLSQIEKIIVQFKSKSIKFNLDRTIDEKYGLNALQIAASTNQFVVLEYLLMRGAKVDVKDKLGNTALAYAVMNQCMQATHTLLQRGADLEAQDKYGYNIVQKAINRESNLVPYLVEERKKERVAKQPVFKLHPRVNRIMTSKWDQFVKSRKFFTGKPLLFPFNDTKGKYRIVFTDYNTHAGLAKQTATKKESV